jgi:hypothetical protein
MQAACKIGKSGMRRLEAVKLNTARTVLSRMEEAGLGRAAPCRSIIIIHHASSEVARTGKKKTRKTLPQLR